LNRSFVRRLGAAAAGIAAVASFASPASAADPSSDLSISFTGTTIASGVDGKFGSFTITNHGPDIPTGVTVTFDLSALDASKVSFDNAVDGCDIVGAIATCHVPDDVVPPAGGNAEILLPIERTSTTGGAAGSISATVSSDLDDPVAGNNAITVNVTIDSSGSDLTVITPDVYALNSGGTDYTTDYLEPGEASFVDVLVANQGDLAAIGIKVSVELPEHVAFESVRPECAVNAGGRQVLCTFEDLVLQPVTFDPAHGAFEFQLPMRTATDAPGPVGLTPGTTIAGAIDVDEPDIPELKALPSGAKWVPFDVVQEVDPTDNVDEFTVFSAGPDLPVTGFKVGMYAGAGLLLLLLGTTLVLLARRRRRAPTPA
jgi:LPXTG-motif cell wall-anchored protein